MIQSSPSLSQLMATVLMGIIVIGLIWFTIRQYGQQYPKNSESFSKSGISFQLYGLSTAAEIKIENIPATPFTEPQPGGSGNPESLLGTFDGSEQTDPFPPYGKFLHVYPVDQYQQFLQENEFGKDSSPDLLKDILVSKSANPAVIPEAPIRTASPVFYAGIKYLNFNEEKGQGVRYLTVYRQDASPISRRELLYIFQGLSDDGKYWVSFSWPVSTEFLPENADENLGGDDYMTWASKYDSYLSGIRSQLDSTQADEFLPNLNQLDSLIESIRIDPLLFSKQ